MEESPIPLTQSRSLFWTMEAPEATLTGFVSAPYIELDADASIDCWFEQTSWRCVLCLIPEPVTVRRGDVVQLAAHVDLTSFPVVHRFEAAVQRADAAA